ncbi:MAG: insulinase family protein [Paludibacteraceae bacterium]|nr:insulinase family protein [Paludibacteraceae bacterium]
MTKDTDTYYATLPCGARIVHRRTPSPVVYTGIMVGAGTRDERPEQNGIAHYIEHCVFKGTTHHTARRLINRIEDIGGEINAYTTKEETTFYAATPAEHYARTIRLIADMVFRPTFPKQETDKELGVILDEIESYNDSPSELIYDDFESLLFRGHPLALPVLGTRKTLRSISRSPQTPVAWMQEHYLPERMVFFSQGNLPFATVLRCVTALTDSLDRHGSLVRTAPPPPEPRSETFRRHTHQTHLMLGARAFPLGHPDQLAAYLLNMILGGGSLNSRLNLSLREKHGLVYTVESQYTPLSDTGYWSVYYACEAQHSQRCFDLVLSELRRLRREPLTSARMARILTQLHGQMAIADENRENSALTMAKQMLYYGYAPTWQETFDNITRLTPIHLTDVANQLFNESNLSVLTYN